MNQLASEAPSEPKTDPVVNEFEIREIERFPVIFSAYPKEPLCAWQRRRGGTKEQGGWVFSM